MITYPCPKQRFDPWDLSKGATSIQFEGENYPIPDETTTSNVSIPLSRMSIWTISRCSSNNNWCQNGHWAWNQEVLEMLHTYLNSAVLEPKSLLWNSILFTGLVKNTQIWQILPVVTCDMSCSAWNRLEASASVVHVWRYWYVSNNAYTSKSTFKNRCA